MENLGASLTWGLVIGASLVLGAVGAARLRLPARVAATLTAFGGGILLAAIALELVPEADRQAGGALTASGLLAGTLVYVAADAWLGRDKQTIATRRFGHAAAAGRPMLMPTSTPTGSAEVMRGESIAVGLFVDGVPESLALGLTIAEGELGIALLTGVVVANIVEAYGAAQPIIAGGRKPSFAIALLTSIGLALAIATVLGGTVLADAGGALVGTAQAIAGGAVLAVVSIAIVPHAFSEVNRLVATATVAGFIAGYLLS
jgi:zinc transporter, ZIP family